VFQHQLFNPLRPKNKPEKFNAITFTSVQLTRNYQASDSGFHLKGANGISHLASLLQRQPASTCQPSNRGWIQGGDCPFKTCKSGLFTMIFCTSENSIRDMRSFCRLFGHSNCYEVYFIPGTVAKPLCDLITKCSVANSKKGFAINFVQQLHSITKISSLKLFFQKRKDVTPYLEEKLKKFFGFC